jgi:glycosyltransferase involved in cell wall biosynthesis
MEKVADCRQIGCNCMNMNLNLRGPCNCFLGYGHCCFNILKELRKICNVSYFPIGQQNLTTQDRDIVIQSIKNQDNFDFKSPSLNIWHQNMLGERIGNGLNTALSFFEIDRLPQRDVNHINSLDTFFVASQWAANIIDDDKRIKISPCVVVPMGVDRSIFNENYQTNNSHTTRFLNLSKIEIRKGHDFLVDIFNKAFDINDDVELIISWNNPFLTDDQTKKWVDLYKNSKLGDKITFVSYLPTDQTLTQLICSCDCLLSPTRAEGAGLPILQALSCGKFVITTNYSAHTEFCTKDNSYLIDIDTLEEAYDGIWFHGEGKWAHIGNKEKEQCVDYMRAIHQKKQSGEELVNTAGIETAKRFSWQNTAEILVEALKDD